MCEWLQPTATIPAVRRENHRRPIVDPFEQESFRDFASRSSADDDLTLVPRHALEHCNEIAIGRECLNLTASVRPRPETRLEEWLTNSDFGRPPAFRIGRRDPDEPARWRKDVGRLHIVSPIPLTNQFAGLEFPNPANLSPAAVIGNELLPIRRDCKVTHRVFVPGKLPNHLTVGDPPHSCGPVPVGRCAA